ncbi:MAG: histidine kinase, partial [Cenarchaeum sp. SB0675_bin_21]|nr:histidine kinase [Cenarchaeum sp. SB0675_bin_21]
MVYLRVKKAKGVEYAYLVKSVWDSNKRTSKQIIIKYLGKLDLITKNDIPPEYK